MLNTFRFCNAFYIIDPIRATREGKLEKGECSDQDYKTSSNQMKVEDNVFINVCFVSLVYN